MKNEDLTPSVVVPFYNRADFLPLVVDALLKQDVSVEVIIVDDGSKDKTFEVSKKYPVKYVFQENSGPASARNRGFIESRGDIVAFTDSDCIAKPDWIRRLIEGFESEDIGVVAGSYDIANHESLLACLIHEEIKWRHKRFGRYIRAFGSYNFAVRRDVFEKTGAFDDSYRTASGEDNDLSYRILKAGYKIRFNPDALVAHYHTERLWKYLKEQFRHAFWRIKLYKEHSEMMKGDDYTIWKDAIEILVSLFAVAGLPLIFTKFWFFEPLILALLFMIQIPFALEISLFKKDVRYLLLAPLCFLRSFARMYGMLRGIWRFWINA